MADLTAQQLHDLMAPLWEREPELRPSKIRWVNKRHYWWISRKAKAEVGIDNDTATQLCESSMHRRLVDKGYNPLCLKRSDQYVAQISFADRDDIIDYIAPTLVQALASACTAVLDAKAETPA